jgi:hypothetical protein
MAGGYDGLSLTSNTSSILRRRYTHLRLVVRKPPSTGSESDILFSVNHLLAVKFNNVVIRP